MSDLKIFKQRWYVLGQPWCHSTDAGLTVIAGSEDPHLATFIANCEGYDEDGNEDLSMAREVAKRIVALHNESLEAQS